MMQFLTITYFDNTILKYIIFFGIFALGWIASKIFRVFFAKFGTKFTRKTKNGFDDAMVEISEKPLSLYIIAFFTWFGFEFLTFPNYPDIPLYFGHLLYLFVAITTAWYVSSLVKHVIEHYLKPLAAKSKTDLDDALVPILQRLSVFVVYAIAIIMILNHFGQEIGPLLAGLGIGGLAFALAAKDLLSNIFGSVTVLLDKPFTLGQRIRINGVDGTVKEINVRTTRIETLDGTQVYIPNAKFTDQIVENVAREEARKVMMTIGLVYGTTNKKMQEAVDVLNKILDKQKGLTETRFVYFTEFGAYSLNILVIYYIKDKDNILPIRHDVNMKIKEEFEKAGIEMAFPTQTIEVKKN